MTRGDEPAAARFYRAALVFLPRAFREAHGEAMTSMFADEWRESGRRRRVVLVIRLVVDLAWTATVERLRVGTAVRGRSRAAGDATDRVRAGRGSAGPSDAARELRIAVRTLSRAPGFTLAVALCIGLGIGASVTMFSATDAILVRRLPYPNAASLVSLRATQEARGVMGATLTQEMLDALKGVTGLAAVGTWRERPADLTGLDSLPERLRTAVVSPDLFGLLGVTPALGAGFDAADAVGDANGAILLSWDLWQRRFGGDPGIVQRTIRINGRSTRVSGVMPRGFSFPEGAVAWEPLVPPRLPPDILFYDGAIGRLASGVTLDRARVEFDSRMEALRRADRYAGWRFELDGLREALAGRLRRPLLILQGAALLLLLLSCANVAALMLARSLARERELVTRAAIGADGRRLAAHVLLESLVLAGAGGAVGGVLAVAGVRLLRLAFPSGVPSWVELAVHPVAIGVLVLLTLGVAAGFGVAPALRATRVRAEAALLGAGRGTSPDHGRARARSLLVAVQVAASVVLVAGATLLARTYAALQDSVGFDPDGILSFTLQLPPDRYSGSGSAELFNGRLEDRLRALPGVAAVSASISAMPLDDGLTSGRWRFRAEDDAPRLDPAERMAAGRLVRPGYFRTLGVPLLLGRDLTRADERADESAAVVNETFANRFFPGGVVGRRILVEMAPGVETPPLRVVGVVRDFRTAPPPAEVQPAIFTLQTPDATAQTLVLRTRSDPAALVRPVREAVHDLDPLLAVARLQTQTSVVERTFWRQRFQRDTIAVVAALALLLAVFGVHGVLSYTVEQRHAEFGVRLAIGASARQLVRHIVGYAAKWTAIGLAAGAAITLALSRVLAGLLYGVTPTDPLSLAATAAIVLAAALLSTIRPALRVTRLDPQNVIRDG